MSELYSWIQWNGVSCCGLFGFGDFSSFGIFTALYVSLVPGGEKKTDMEQERENEFLWILKCFLKKQIEVSELIQWVLYYLSCFSIALGTDQRER